ncbi:MULTISPECIES: class I adenylate-forming enzyme family protein [unclassified Nocardia]|uniref:class I adenylate-forming enzyme family protein n=1 Tax=unclassified Nocardia TaxID=2637762 RepID=UPI001CE43E3C|nr:MULTISPECIES: AMP-binding protein [unclassified Nocardia]
MDAIAERHKPGENPSPTGTFADLLTERANERTFLEDARDGRTITYRELPGAASAWSRRLDSLGAGPGAIVVVDLADPLSFAVAFLAIIACGRCALPVDPRAPVAELRRTLRAVHPIAAVTARPELAAALGIPPLSLDDPTPPPDTYPVRYAGRGSVLLSTSGSTGEPKQVLLSEHRLLHVARAVAEHHRLTAADRGYNCLPLFHINAEVVALLATSIAGGCLVLNRRFRASGFWPLLAARRITWLNAVPAMLAVLAAGPAPESVGALRFIRSASAPLPAAVRSGIAERTGLPIVESYGMTEAASQITATPLDGSAPPGSCGRPVRVELEIRDRDGMTLPPGSIGRVHIRGDGVIGGYLGGSARDCFDDAGWLDTGDLGRVDDAGYVYLTARADDVINRGGELLYPREIEEVLLPDPGVREVVVIGRRDPVLGYVPVAFAIPSAPDGDGDALAERLHQRCARQLTPFKRPVEIRFVDEFPRSPTGKVRRHLLRDRADAVRGGT